MHLGDQRTGRVEHLETARLRVPAHRLRDPVRAENHRAAGRHLVELLDENRPFRFQVFDDELVVHDLVPHVNRCAVQRKRTLHDVDRTIDSGAETAGFGEQDLHGA